MTIRSIQVSHQILVLFLLALSLLVVIDQCHCLSIQTPTAKVDGKTSISRSRRDVLSWTTKVTAAFAASSAVTRTTIATTTAAVTSSLLLPKQIATAASTGPTAEDLERITIGYKQINYLLDNFEQETTVCRENGGECKRDADAIRRALGLRSTKDPLFQIDKVFSKVKNMDLDPDKLEAFFDASEEWSSATNMSNSMAFISQFGEYNPGGGQDEVLKYLKESQKQVIMAQKALKTIMDCLDIPQ